MNNLLSKTIPQELIVYKKIIDELENNKEEDSNIPSYLSNIEIKRDSRGRVVSHSHYNVDNELVKQVFFNGDEITAINYYRNEILSRKEIYDSGLLLSNYAYKKNGSCVYELHYSYDNRGKINSIQKKAKDMDFLIKYEYDSLERIISRQILVNNALVTRQQYTYDILNRVIEYKDENQKIFVHNISKKNELISYTITDKIGNEILITNHFVETGYVNTEFTLNGHSTTLVDTSYVDNVMLKRPYTNEDDLDLIISNLFSTQDKIIDQPKREISNKSLGLIDYNIEMRILPISIRKRVLYNISLNNSKS